jgi:hypothetical protein
VAGLVTGAGGGPERRLSMSMKLALVGTCALLAALAVGVLSAQAADVTVGLGACFFQQGGQTTVPAGSTITLRLRNFEANRGMVRDYVQAQQTTFSLNGGAPIDLSGDYSAPAFLNGLWFTETTYATGVTLASAGNSLTVDFAVTLSRNFVEQFNGPMTFADDGSPIVTHPILNPSGSVYEGGTCTITAV